MIGGEDYTLIKHFAPTIMRTIIGTTQLVWRDAWFENDTLWSRADNFRSIKWKLSSEIFIYKNLKSLKSWTKHGRTKNNASNMIYVIYDKKSISFVHENQPVIDLLVKRLGYSNKATSMKAEEQFNQLLLMEADERKRIIKEMTKEYRLMIIDMMGLPKNCSQKILCAEIAETKRFIDIASGTYLKLSIV